MTPCYFNWRRDSWECDNIGEAHQKKLEQPDPVFYKKDGRYIEYKLPTYRRNPKMKGGKFVNKKRYRIDDIWD